MRYMHVRTHDIKTLFEIQTHQFLHLCALRGFVKKERWRMGRPKADPEAAKPDVLVPKSCLLLVVPFHRSYTQLSSSHNPVISRSYSRYDGVPVCTCSKPRSTRSFQALQAKCGSLTACTSPCQPVLAQPRTDGDFCCGCLQ